jgi:hypothetical protein
LTSFKCSDDDSNDSYSEVEEEYIINKMVKNKPRAKQEDILRGKALKRKQCNLTLINEGSNEASSDEGSNS